MAELDMEKDFGLEDLAGEMDPQGDDFGLDEFASDPADTSASEIAEFAPTEVEEIDDEVGMEKIASCFPDWSLTPEEMFKVDEAISKQQKKKKQK